ncbi:unnamed protein product [Paramecium sonneborni]|uniref:Uncharacterized protein n=1 Tax=Paramecium sonneborni TaxID=65129 RepID=A0A8S1REV0_9CILI|nr:unnamed protein product [Paramecium sonneborni]
MSVKLNPCTICNQDGELFICISPQCLKSENNKLSCYKCFHKSHNSQQHQPESYKNIQQTSQQNQKAYVKFIEQHMKDNANEQEMYEKYLDDTFQKIRKWFDDQKKTIKVHYEKEYQILRDNINQDQTEELNLKQQLKFFSYKQNDYIELIEKRNQQFQRYKNFEMMELDFKIQYLIQTQLILPYIGTQDYLNLTFNQDKQNEILYCQFHKTQKKYLCTNQNCVSNNNNNNCFCEFCIIEKKICHQDKDLIKIEEISSKLEEKKQQIFQQNIKIENEVISEIDKYVEKNWKYEKQQLQNKVQIKALLIAEVEAFKNLKEVQDNYFKIKPINPILYAKSQEQLNSEFQNIYEILKKKLSNDQKKGSSIALPSPLESSKTSTQLNFTKEIQSNKNEKEIQPNKFQKEILVEKIREKSQTFYTQIETPTLTKRYKNEFDLNLLTEQNNLKSEVKKDNHKQRQSIKITEIQPQNQNYFLQGFQKNFDHLYSNKSETIQNKNFDFERADSIQQTQKYDYLNRSRPSLAQDNLNKFLDDKFLPKRLNTENQKQISQNSFQRKDHIHTNIINKTLKG